MSARDELRDCFLSDSRDRFEAAADKYRAEVLAEAHGEVVAWLEKKAREHHAQGKRYEKQAAVIWRLADKVSRGAVKVFPYKPGRRVEDVRADEIGGGPRG